MFKKVSTNENTGVTVSEEVKQSENALKYSSKDYRDLNETVEKILQFGEEQNQQAVNSILECIEELEETDNENTQLTNAAFESIESNIIKISESNKKNYDEIMKGKERINQVKTKITSNTQKNIEHINSINNNLIAALQAMENEYL